MNKGKRKGKRKEVSAVAEETFDFRNIQGGFVITQDEPMKLGGQPLTAFMPQPYIFVGIDFGQARDYTAVVVIECGLVPAGEPYATVEGPKRTQWIPGGTTAGRPWMDTTRRVPQSGTWIRVKEDLSAWFVSKKQG